MKLKDLKTGMVVKNREGDYYIVINDCIVNEKTFDFLKNYNDNLTNIYSRNLDIVEVYKERKGAELKPKNWFNNIEEEPIWKREEVDWSNIPMWTKVQVRDSSNEEWRNAYFLNYQKNNNFPFKVTFYDKFTFEGDLFDNFWKQCRLYKKEVINNG